MSPNEQIPTQPQPMSEPETVPTPITSIDQTVAPTMHPVADVMPPAPSVTSLETPQVITKGPAFLKVFKGLAKKPRLPIVLAALALLSLVGGIVFYFAYWTSSAVVYERFQKNIAEVIDKTGDSEIDLVNDYTYTVEVSSDSDELKLSVNSDGRAVESGFETLSGITYKDAELSVEGRLLNESNGSPYQLYFKLTGIKEMLDAVIGDSTSVVDGSKLSAYDDTWISVDLTSYLDTEDEGEKAKALQKKQYKELWKAFTPIFESRLVGLGDDDKDVYIASNPRSAKVAGKSVWAYDVSYDKQANNEMMDELIKAVDTTSLDAAQKDLVKKTIETGKEYLPEDDEESTTSSYGSKYTQEEKYTIWIEKNSGILMQFTATSESFIDKVSDSKTTLTASITDIKPEIIKGSVSLKVTSEFSNVEGKVSIVQDNKKQTLTASGDFKSIYPDDDNAESKIKFTVKVAPNTKDTPIKAPEGAIDIQQVIQDLFGESY